ncbi:MAG TPA: fibro-slime domain-containing protein [Xenococcaceae cyanobacterium]
MSHNTMVLVGTLRDFKDTHPDFERTPGVEGFDYGLDHEITTDTIGENKKPQYKNGSYSTTNKTNFDQWYRDVVGVNQSTSYSIELKDEDKDGIYTYYNASFFPLDNMTDFDAQGRSHNYHFTYELHSQFSYHGGETFEFRGDDDVWVYINGKKVVDLGGVHSEKIQSINLDTIANRINITPGNNYDFDLFFAERHTTQSNFKIQTNLDFVIYSD